MSANRTLLRRACATALVCGAAFLSLQEATPAATLVHRYDFNTNSVSGTTYDNGDGTFTLFVTNVADVVGGTAWDGALPNGGIFTNIVNGSVTNDAVALFSSVSQFVQFPPGVVSNYTAITVDMWASVPGAALGGSDGNGFLFTFGNTDANGNGGRCIFFQPGDARLTIAAGQPSWGTEQSARLPAFVGTTNDLHLTCIIDPPTGRLLVFTNGALAGASYTLSTPMSAVSNVFNYIGKSLFSADGYRNAIVDEFRIWNGALSGLEVAGCDLAGPDNTTPSTITVTNITASVPLSNIAQGGRTTVVVTGTASNFPNPVSVDSYLCTFTSANTKVLTVDTNGVITAVGPGTSSVTIQYGSASNSVSVTVFQPATVLNHRYSFNGDLHDSVGGTNWDGVATNGVDLTTLPGQAILDSAASQYIQFPSGIITNYVALTVDMWCSFPTFFDGNCFLWAFGNTAGGDLHGANYVFAQPSQGRVAISGWDPGWAGPEQQVAGAGNLTSLYTTPATEVHLTSVINPAAGWMAVYTNGVLVGQNNSITWPMSSVYDVYNYIAKSLYNADAYISVDVDEYRIYNGALTAGQVAQAQTLGPDAVPDLSPPPTAPTLSFGYSAGSLMLSWPTNAAGFALMSKTALTEATWNPVGTSPSISGTNYQVTLPAANTSQFFLLSK